MRDLAVKAVCKPDGEGVIQRRFAEKFSAILTLIDNRVAEVPWLAGEQFSAADIMVVCCLTTMRCFNPYHLGEHKNILAYLNRVSEREGFRRAKLKADPELDIALLIGAAPPPLQKGIPALNKGGA
jgi:glutathione S-transferase